MAPGPDPPGNSRGANPATLLSALGFRGGLDTPMNRLSKGNAQKVGLAQALCSGAHCWSSTNRGPDSKPTPAGADRSRRAARRQRHRRRADRPHPDSRNPPRPPGSAPARSPADHRRPTVVTISLRCADPDRVAERLPLRGTTKRQCL
jgi:hypothetical protein